MSKPETVPGFELVLHQSTESDQKAIAERAKRFGLFIAKAYVVAVFLVPPVVGLAVLGGNIAGNTFYDRVEQRVQDESIAAEQVQEIVRLIEDQNWRELLLREVEQSELTPEEIFEVLVDNNDQQSEVAVGEELSPAQIEQFLDQIQNESDRQGLINRLEEGPLTQSQLFALLFGDDAPDESEEEGQTQNNSGQNQDAQE